MARILSSRFARGGFGINLDGNVGTKGGNERSDVGIVQFALRLLTDGEFTPFGREAAALSLTGVRLPIGVDGFFGPQTKAFIDAYQAFRVKSPGPGTNPLPRPDSNFGNFRITNWNFGLLEDDVNSAKRRSVIDLLRNDSRAPAFLKPFFLSDA